MPALNNLPSASRLTSTDIMLRDVSAGNDARKITAAQMASDLAGLVNYRQHRNTIRGKNLGSSLTSAQLTAISNGTFDDIFVGDYWTIGGIVYQIADIDYWYLHGDSSYFDKHHVVVVPTTNLYNQKMNDTNTSEGAYANSKMRTTYLADALSTIQNAFGANLLTHREMLENAVTDGVASGASWYDSTVDLMSETMVFGHRISSMNHRNAYANSKSQLALYALWPNSTGRESSFWLRDVASDGAFTSCTAYMTTTIYVSSESHGVRPAFAVGV